MKQDSLALSHTRKSKLFFLIFHSHPHSRLLVSFIIDMGILSFSPSRSRPCGREDRLANEKLKRNRRSVDGHLRKMKSVLGKGLVLKDGICCFMHGRFVVVIEVPESDPCKAILSTCVYQITDPKQTDAHKMCSKWCKLQKGNDGPTLEVGDGEVNLCLEIPIEGRSSYHEFRDRLVVYLNSAADINRALGNMDARSLIKYV